MRFPRQFLPSRWFSFLALLVALELLADVLAKQFAVSGNGIFALLSLLSFAVANMAWLASLRSGLQLGKGAILFGILSSMGAVLVGLFVYQEHAGFFQIIGMIIGIVALGFLSKE